MLDYLKHESNYTYTENGALTHITTESDLVDLFATLGALRGASDAAVTDRFARAFAERSDLAMKLAFYGRDVRGGLGERRVFRLILKWLAKYAPDALRRNLEYIPEYGRYDDLLALVDTQCEDDVIELIRGQLEHDRSSDAGVSLLAKWLPSVNASNCETVKQAKHIARRLGMNDAAYRRLLSELRAKIAIIENNLRERDYTFDYSKQPSQAMLKYRKAFIRNDKERYVEFLESVRRGEVSMHTGTLTPYDIISPCFDIYGDLVEMTDDERRSIDTAWNSLDDCCTDENSLAVVDGSGSMYCNLSPRPIAVAMSLGIYFAERCKGAFHNHFITFSEHPQLVEVKGADIVEKVGYCSGYNEVANTNLSGSIQADSAGRGRTLTAAVRAAEAAVYHIRYGIRQLHTRLGYDQLRIREAALPRAWLQAAGNCVLECREPEASAAGHAERSRSRARIGLLTAYVQACRRGRALARKAHV